MFRGAPDGDRRAVGWFICSGAADDGVGERGSPTVGVPAGWFDNLGLCCCARLCSGRLGFWGCTQLYHTSRQIGAGVV
jgi:hypothetical protein